jgi:hypothetical protein
LLGGHSKMAKLLIDQHQLKTMLSYDPDTGVFVWLVRASDKTKIGSVAGYIETTGRYWAIGLNGHHYFAHRLAWLYVHGKWPDNDIDHINGIRTDNKLCNLRDVTRRVNLQNLKAAKPNNLTGLLGVSKARGKFWARIWIGKKRISLGYFYTPEEAHIAYLDAKRRLHEGCTI